MKTKTSELTDAALDWAVATCEGATGFSYDTVSAYWMTLNGKDIALTKGWSQSFLPSTDWSQGGPIIEREEISLAAPDALHEHWTALKDFVAHKHDGTTPLIAAMRCYVASKLGDEVDVPAELMPIPAPVVGGKASI